MFKKDDTIHKKSIKKIDAIVTGMLLGGVVASIYGIKYGIKKIHEHEDHADKEKRQEGGEEKKNGIRRILKMLIFGYDTPTIEKKPGFFSRLFKK